MVGRLPPLVPGCEGQGDRDKRANGDSESPGSSEEVFGHLGGLQSDEYRRTTIPE